MKQVIASALTLCLFCLLPSCVHESGPRQISAMDIQKESLQLQSRQDETLAMIEQDVPKTIDAEPVMPHYDPLEDHMVSFSMVDADLRTILYLLADTVGMNLMIGEHIDDNDRKVTLHFQNISARTVLNELVERFDLHCEITENIIKVSAFTERVYHLNFLDTHVETSFDIGGDVLGASSAEANSGLAGSVKLKATGSKKGNAFDLLEEMIRDLKSSQGIFSINRLAGSLYVKDRPSVVRRISRLVNQYRDMMVGQILIEARIIEVSLSDGYEYGIDWDLLRSESDTTHRLNQALWNLQNGLVLKGMNRSFNLSMAIKTLKQFGDVKIVSNPTIRARHGIPAVISVGDSISYIKSVKTTVSQSTTTATDETVDVEISTVFDGLILGVIPFIEEGGKINLMINPVKSDVDTGSIENPLTIGKGASISLPRVGIKEINTTISMDSQDVIILGGLISKEENKVNKGVPYISDVPVIGYLFKNQYVKQARKELVIILTVTVI